MKKIVLILLAGAAAFLAFHAGRAAAAAVKLQNLNFITVQLKFQLQGSFVDDGAVRTYANPTIQKFETKDLLAVLAQDKYIQTNYPANFFPSGSKLGITPAGIAVVVDRNNEFLVDVSDIVRLETSTNGILSGKVDNTTGLARPNFQEQALVRMVFDDTWITNSSNLSFTVQGLGKIKTKDSQPNQAGKYHEVSNQEATSASGEGQSKGVPFVTSGSIKGSLNADLLLFN